MIGYVNDFYLIAFKAAPAALPPAFTWARKSEP
jgi:hypothetical protein